MLEMNTFDERSRSIEMWGIITPNTIWQVNITKWMAHVLLELTCNI